MKTTAILVDGGFYRKQATYHFGKKSAHERIHELIRYCRMHLMERSQFALVDTPNGNKKRHYQWNNLYRIFYYDCPPISKTLYHPLLKKNIDFIVDPMGHKILPDLMEHIDGLQSYYKQMFQKSPVSKYAE